MSLTTTLDISRVQILKDNITHLENSREKIISRWTSSEDVFKILTKHGVDEKYFQTTYAYPVLNYFIDVVKGTQRIGNCPVIAKLLEYLKERNITPSELFIICINFRAAIIKKMFIKDIMNEALYENISYVFDANFRGVLEMFNDSLIEAKNESKRLYEISIRDHLTNIYNKKMFDEIINLEIKNAKRNNTTFSLIIIDIDFFKTINDTHGHKVGDETLVALSHLLQSMLRDSDTLARWGGEEFIILMPKSNTENSKKKAEKIRKAIEEHLFQTVTTLTCSLGVAGYRDGDDATSLFNAADEALYLSKSTGRNKVTTY